MHFEIRAASKYETESFEDRPSLNYSLFSNMKRLTESNVNLRGFLALSQHFCGMLSLCPSVTQSRGNFLVNPLKLLYFTHHKLQFFINLNYSHTLENWETTVPDPLVLRKYVQAKTRLYFTCSNIIYPSV